MALAVVQNGEHHHPLNPTTFVIHVSFVVSSVRRSYPTTLSQKKTEPTTADAEARPNALHTELSKAQTCTFPYLQDYLRDAKKKKNYISIIGVLSHGEMIFCFVNPRVLNEGAALRSRPPQQSLHDDHEQLKMYQAFTEHNDR